MDTKKVSQAFLDDIFTHALARAAMLATPVVMALLCYLGTSWLDGRFDGINQKLENTQQEIVMAAKRTDDLSTSIDGNTNNDRQTHDRLLVLEQATQAARSDRDEFQKRVLDQLGAMQRDINRSSVDIAAISAIMMQQQQKQGMLNVMPSISPFQRQGENR